MTSEAKISSERDACGTVPVSSMTTTVRWGISFSNRVVRSSNGWEEWTPDETVQTKSKSAMPLVMNASAVALIDALRRPSSC